MDPEIDDRESVFNKLKQLTRDNNNNNNENLGDWNKTETHIKKEFPPNNMLVEGESEVFETEELTTPKKLQHDRPQISPRTQIYFPIEKPIHYIKQPTSNTRTGVIKKGSNGKKKPTKKKAPPKKKKLKPLKRNGESYDENDLFDFQSESVDYDFEEIIKKPQKKVVEKSIDENDESSEVKSVIEFYDSLDIDYGTAERDTDLIKRVRKLFNAVTVEKANKVLTKSVNIRVTTSIQVILQHLDDVTPWVGHVYDGQNHVGQLDTYDIAAFLVSIYPRLNSQEELNKAGNIIQERTAGDLIKRQKNKPFRCKLSTPLLDLVYGLDRKGKDTSAVIAEFDQEYIPTIGLIGLLNLVYQEVSDLPLVASQPISEFSIFSDKIAILPASTKMNVVIAVLVESRHTAVAIVNDQGALIAEFKPQHIKSINVASYSLITLTALDYIQNTTKINKPPVAVPSTRFEEALRIMVSEGRESLWVVGDRSSNIPLGVIDALNILRYLCMRVQKKPLSGTWRYKTKVEEDLNDPNFYNLLFHQQAIKQGYMEILIPKQKKYIQRFFLLKQNILIHFPQVNNIRMLDKTQHIHPLTNFTVENQGTNEIVLIDSKKQFRLKCKSELERNEWSDLIRSQTTSLQNK